MAVGIINSGEAIIRANGAITRDVTAIVDEDGIITADIPSMTIDVMFVMITVATIISRRFGRISKTFAMREMKSNKIAGNSG
jgi:hypothetical protein